MELKYLEIFFRVVELRSFSKAAAALFLTQPTVSTHIKNLEEKLGIKLIDRLGREVVPTKAGQILYNYVSEIIKLQKEAVQALDQFMGKISGNLEVGASTIPGEYIISPAIGGFKRLYPGIITTLLISDTRKVANMVLEGNVEIGVVGAQIDDKPIESREFLRDTLVLVAPPSYTAPTISLRELARIPLIFRERGSGSRVTLEKALEEKGLKSSDLNIVAEMGSTEAVKQAIKAGLGLSVLSKLSVKEELISGRLKAVRIKGLSIQRSFFIITHALKVKSPLCRAFLDFLGQITKA